MNNTRLQYALLFLLLFCTITSAKPMANDIVQSTNSTSPSEINLADISKIVYPRIGNPAIVLNGSTFEIRVRGPANISNWNIKLHREYAEYTVSFENPVRNTSTGMWHINVSVPSDSMFVLFDLVISISDGISSSELIEKNAVQIWNEYPSNLKLVHITDTHIRSNHPEADTKLLSALYQASAGGADLIIITGDLVQYADAKSFRRFYNLLSHSSVPVFVLPGNHDADNDEFANYMSFFGDDYYTVSLGLDILLIMANAHNGELNSTQIGWIERDFRDSNAEIKILGIHYSLTNLLYYNEVAAHELIRICSENNVDIVLTGHSHSDWADNENGTLWIQTTSLGIRPTTGGHGRNGFRVIEFQENILTLWNWTNDQPWSQPWDTVKLTRYPMRAHEIDVGAYLSITNNLNYSIDEQVLDFLVEPITGNQHYIATGAEIISTVNGTEAYLVRVGFDLDSGQSIKIRIFPNNTQAPSLLSVQFPDTVFVGEEYIISANLTTPPSGLIDVHVKIELNNESMGQFPMSKSGGNEWHATLEHDASGEITFQISASDYSGLRIFSEIYSITCLTPETPEETEPSEISSDWIPFLIGSIGLVAGVFIVVYIIQTKKGGSIDQL